MFVVLFLFLRFHSFFKLGYNLQTKSDVSTNFKYSQILKIASIQLDSYSKFRIAKWMTWFSEVFTPNNSHRCQQKKKNFIQSLTSVLWKSGHLFRYLNIALEVYLQPLFIFEMHKFSVQSRLLLQFMQECFAKLRPWSQFAKETKSRGAQRQGFGLLHQLIGSLSICRRNLRLLLQWHCKWPWQFNNIPFSSCFLFFFTTNIC